jgi:alanine racemase
MAMVKAFSYGSGSFEIANVLQYHKVDYLAVAYADEGDCVKKSRDHNANHGDESGAISL